MIRRTIAVLLVTLSIAAGLVMLHSWTAYGTLAWWRIPQRISWCGRDYRRTERSLTLADVTAQPVSLPGDAPYPYATVARVPPVAGRPLVTARTPEASRHRVEPPLPCAMVVYLKTGPDRYAEYVILGGP